MHSKLIYPTVSEVNQASETSLYDWSDNLPEPQTDVERTVYKRIRKKCWLNSLEVVRKTDPEIAGKLDELSNAFTELFGEDAREL